MAKSPTMNEQELGYLIRAGVTSTATAKDRLRECRILARLINRLLRSQVNKDALYGAVYDR